MTPTEARTWIIKASLLVYGCVFVFFAVAPALQFPLKYADAINVMKIIVPIFASYLGAATLFVISGQELEDTEPRSEMLGVLAKWPVVLFGIALVARNLVVKIRLLVRPVPLRDHDVAFDALRPRRCLSR